MIWEGAEVLLARLERWRPGGWVEHAGGGLQVCHTPKEGSHAYLHWLYPGLSEERLAQTEAVYDRPLPAEYRRYLGQPISLDHGNLFGRPAGAPATAWVIGHISGWSGQGSLLLHQSGEVRLCSNTDARDVAAVWGSFGEMLLAEFDRMGALVGDRGEALVEYVQFLPEGGRRWEQPPKRRWSLRSLLGG